MHQPPPPFRDYARYFALACALLVTSCCPTLLLGLGVLSQFNQFNQSVSLGTNLLMGIVAGLLVAITSTVLLPQQLLKDMRWFVINIVGMIVSVAGYFFVLSILPLPRGEDPVSLHTLFAIICLVALTGVPIGCAQWIFLRNYAAFAYRWVLMLSVSWGIGGAVYIFYLWIVTNG
jgi:hypothetical protein